MLRPDKHPDPIFSVINVGGNQKQLVPILQFYQGIKKNHNPCGVKIRIAGSAIGIVEIPIYL
jgi:hypothetical protein